MSSSSILVNHCNSHDSHLFAEPLCKDLPLLRRIANVAFHVLTLGVPLALYHLTSLCCSRRFAVRKIDDLAAGASEDVKPYSPLAQEALEFARAKLREHPDLRPGKFSSGSGQGNAEAYQPTDPEIASLANLYSEVIYPNFKDLMRDTENPWENDEVINAADECIKIVFAISNLTLDDLKPFTESLDVEMSFAEALTTSHSYQRSTFYTCPVFYHTFRSGATWNTVTNTLSDVKPVPKPHAQAFYKKGTRQNTWNQLYNEYCDRVRLYVKEEDLNQYDPRTVSWTKRDTGPKTFLATPDSIPN